MTRRGTSPGPAFPDRDESPSSQHKRPRRAIALDAASRLLAGVSISLVLLLAAAPRSAAQSLPWFQGVGDLAGGAVDSEASAISADGSVVVGASESTSGTEAFRWTEGGGIVGLGFLSMSGPRSEAFGVSANGAVIVGVSRNGSGERAYRWTSGSGLVTLGTLSCSSCDPATSANGVSADGLVAVGAGLAKSLFGDPHLDAVRWTGGGTSISNLGDLPGPAELNSAEGASQNGATIVGEGDSNSGLQAWAWTSGTGPQALPGVAGAQIRSGAMAISSDASTVVGFTNTDPASTSHLEAVRWTGASFGTLQLLGSLPAAATPSSQALAVSGDGSIIVGKARNATNSERAFIWDATNGMRELGDVLESDYGLDLTGWTLKAARGVSDVDLDGTFLVAGVGVDPNGDSQGWVAQLATPACRNLADDDLDLATDFPADNECTSTVDLSELYDCNDSIDNDGDGDIDYPADLECVSASDQTERPDCNDGYDNDGDGDTDHPADPGCAGPDMLIEDPACDNGVDDDFDLATDHPADSDCVTRADLSEVADCNDGLDNDGDGGTDHPADSECESPSDQSEQPQCSDGIDNDGDGRTDYPYDYPDCIGATDPLEMPQCSDGADNDLDGQIDLADLDCPHGQFPNESPGVVAAGDLLVVDRMSRAVFGVDPVSGAQSLLSEKAQLQEPQGVALRNDGKLVIADPVGLVEIDSGGGQRLASAALSVASSLQVLFEASGDALVLETDGVNRIAWDPVGQGAKTPFLAVPTAEPLPILGVLAGGTLAMESSGDLLTTGLGFSGDGVFRIDAVAPAASILKPGFATEMWLDLAVEADGTILGVGAQISGGPGLYRIDPVSGLATALSVGAPWVMPTAVARNAAGDIYVADAGTCAGGSCTGGSIAHVHPVSGARTVISTGGNIEGEMDLIVAVPEAGGLPMLLAGIAWLWMAGRRRSGGRHFSASQRFPASQERVGR